MFSRISLVLLAVLCVHPIASAEPLSPAAKKLVCTTALSAAGVALVCAALQKFIGEEATRSSFLFACPMIGLVSFCATTLGERAGTRNTYLLDQVEGSSCAGCCKKLIIIFLGDKILFYFLQKEGVFPFTNLYLAIAAIGYVVFFFRANLMYRERLLPLTRVNLAHTELLPTLRQLFRAPAAAPAA